jgi:hypothetical protein
MRHSIVVRNIAMLDTNVLVLLLLRTVPRFNNANRRLRNYHSQLQITTELIHQSILDEVGNLFVKNFGTPMANVILSRFFTSSYYQIITTSEVDRGRIVQITNNHPSVWSQNIYNGNFEHKGIGYADAQFLLSAERFAKSGNYDNFNILTYDYDLRVAMQDPIYALVDYVKTDIPRRDQNLITVESI